jgi:disulfide bond formation protein DsbB
MLLSARQYYLIGFIFCFIALSIAGYFQFIEHLEPCPLCILQRVAILVIGVVCLLAFLHNSQGLMHRVYACCIAVVALIGGGVSARHVWIQNLPEDQVPACGPGLNFMLNNFPLNEALNMVLRGSGECADVLWRFLGLTIPAWTLIAFVGLFLIGLKQLFNR